jgi:hypothetical protein
MSRRPKKPPPIEDEAQSKRFMDLAHELEAAGELSADESGAAFERLSRKVMPPKARGTDGGS